MMKINHCSSHTVNKVSITLIERTNQIPDGITRSYDANLANVQRLVTLACHIRRYVLYFVHIVKRQRSNNSCPNEKMYNRTSVYWSSVQKYSTLGTILMQHFRVKCSWNLYIVTNCFATYYCTCLYDIIFN